MTIPSSGRTCLSGATVGGNLTVPAGASLVLKNSTVRGNLSANGASAITICDSNIGGGLSVFGTTGQVVVGDGGDDGAPPCAGNSVGGNATVSNNTARTELGANHVSGSVSFNNNTGPTGPESSPELESNVIAGSLACSGDVSVTHDSQPNSVSGSRSGQCGAPGF